MGKKILISNNEQKDVSALIAYANGRVWKNATDYLKRSCRVVKFPAKKNFNYSSLIFINYTYVTTCNLRCFQKSICGFLCVFVSRTIRFSFLPALFLIFDGTMRREGEKTYNFACEMNLCEFVKNTGFVFCFQTIPVGFK